METLAMQDDLQEQVLAAVRSCTLFRALKEEQLPQLVKVAELMRFAPEEIILRQGDASDSFYVLIQGDAAVRLDKAGDGVEIGRVPKPSSIGEVGLLLGETRSATVAAKTEVLALKFTARAFEAMFQKIPNFGQGLSAGLAY